MATRTSSRGRAAARRRHRTLRSGGVVVRALAVVTSMLAVFAVAGCGAGLNAETSREVPGIPGVDADAGPIGLRDLTIPFRAGGYPRGGDVPLVVRVFSTAWQPVTVSRVAPAAPGYMTVPAQRITLRQPGTAGAGRGTGSMVVPPQGELQLVPGAGPYLVAEHITAALPYGTSVPVRFTFSTGDSVDIDVPMAPPAGPVTAQPTPHVPGPSATTSAG